MKQELYHGEPTRRAAVWKYGSYRQRYILYRLPGVVVTKKGTVLIYCEARTLKETDNVGNNIDLCLMDVVMRRSTDGGKTFDEGTFLAYGNTQYETMNNPLMIVGNDNTVHFFYCRNCTRDGGGAWYRRSTDDGVTWSEPRCLDAFLTVPHHSLLFGPGHGLCTRGGRLIAPVWTVTPDAKNFEAYTLYSDDNGETWAMSERASANKDETTVGELSDGRIMLNSRCKPRRVTVSPDGAAGWSPSYDDPNLPDPFCMGGMETVRIPGVPHALLFSNCANEQTRTNVTVKCSFDDGKSWTPFLIDEFEGGYSDVAIDPNNGKVYVVYETFLGSVTRFMSFSFADVFLKNKS